MLAQLPDSPLDIVGDVHGELDALNALINQLGYNDHGHHPDGRKLVFIGDLCDRGPNSFGVFQRVIPIVERGNGFAVLGNHELNLLRAERKDGNNWFWGESDTHDLKYEPYHRVSNAERVTILDFIEKLPLALEREDLRIVHAVWHDESIQKLRDVESPFSISNLYDKWDAEIEIKLAESGLLKRSKKEKDDWMHALVDPGCQVPLLSAIGQCDEVKQMENPLRVLVSGMERLCSTPFFSSGKWRFAERVRWWEEYRTNIPVIVGHYWRRMVPYDRSLVGKGDPDLFAEVEPTAWHGALGNVFCVDYSAGGRFQERRSDQVIGSTTKLAALRWPERSLVLDTGEVLETQGFKLIVS